MAQTDPRDTPRDEAPTGSSHHLSEDECWQRLESAPYGRLAVVGRDEQPEIYPVNHRVHRRSILIRTARGAKLEMIADRPRVAFEVDGADESWHWSVIVKGSATQVTSEMELLRSGVSELATWTHEPKHFVFKITPDAVTGRRFDLGVRTVGPVYAVPATGAVEVAPSRSRADRPWPIPHFGPPEPRAGAADDDG